MAIINQQISKFMAGANLYESQEKAVIGKKNIYTDHESNIAILPRKAFENIYNGAIITANNQSRYVISKNNKDNSVILNNSANWYNLGRGYSFTYMNPKYQILDNSNDIVGYITRSGLLHFTSDQRFIKLNQIISNDDNGVKILNQYNEGIYIDDSGDVYIGSDSTIWTPFSSAESSWGEIDGNITNQIDLISLLSEKLETPEIYTENNLIMFDNSGNIVDSGQSLTTLNIDGGTF